MNFYIITIDDVTVFDFVSKTIVPLANINTGCLLPGEEVANLVLEESLTPLLSLDDSEKVRIFGTINPNIIVDRVAVFFKDNKISSVEYTDLVSENKDVVLFTDVKAGLSFGTLMRSIDLTRADDYYLHVVHSTDGEDLLTMVEKGIDVFDTDIMEPFTVSMRTLATGDIDTMRAIVGKSIRRVKNPSFKNYSFQIGDKFGIKLRILGDLITDNKYSLPQDIDVTDKNTWYYIESDVKINYNNGMGIVTVKESGEIDTFILQQSLTYRYFVNECESYLHSTRFKNISGIVLEHVEVPVKPLPEDDPFYQELPVKLSPEDILVVEELPIEELPVDEPFLDEELPPKDILVDEELPPKDIPLDEELPVIEDKIVEEEPLVDEELPPKDIPLDE